MSTTKAHTLTDGTTIKVRTQRTIAGQAIYTELPSRKRSGSQLMRLGDHMFLVGRRHLVSISHPKHEYASTDKAGAELALAFFVDSAEACIAESLREGYPIEDNYAKPEGV